MVNSRQMHKGTAVVVATAATKKIYFSINDDNGDGDEGNV